MSFKKRFDELKRKSEELLETGKVVLPDALGLSCDLLRREDFYEIVQSSWLYYYLALGSVFGQRPPNTKEMGAIEASPLKCSRIENELKRQFIFELDRSRGNFYNSFDWRSIVLSEIWVEIWHMIHCAVERANQTRKVNRNIPGARNLQPKLSAFRYGPKIRDKYPEFVVVDVLSAWFLTRDCRTTQIDIDGRLVTRFETDQQPSQFFGVYGNSSEYANLPFVYKASDSDHRKNLTSLSCFPSFYNDYRCFGITRVSGDVKANEVPRVKSQSANVKDTYPSEQQKGSGIKPREIKINGKTLSEHQEYYDAAVRSNDTRSQEYLDCFSNGLWPLIKAIEQVDNFGYDHKFLITFGAKTEASRSAASFDLQDGDLAYSAFLTIGVNCDEDVAIAIEEEIAKGIRTLQAELFAAASKEAIDRAQEAHTIIALKSTALARSKQLLDTLREPFENLSTNLNDALLNIQQLQGIYNVPVRGVYQRAHRIRDLFSTGHKRTVCKKNVFIKHEIVHYDDEDAKLVLLAVFGDLLGLEGSVISEGSFDSLANEIAERLFSKDESDILIRELIRSLACGYQEEKLSWIASVTTSPRPILGRVKLILHTSLKPSSDNINLELEHLIFALPRANFQRLQEGSSENKAPSKYLLASGCAHPFPTIGMMIEAIAGISSIGDPTSSLGENIDIQVSPTIGITVLDPDDDRLQMFTPTKCEFFITRRNGNGFLKTNTQGQLHDQRLEGLLDQSRRESWLASNVKGTAGDFFEPIVNIVRFASKSDEFELQAQFNAGMLILSWKSKSCIFSVSLGPNKIIVVSEVKDV